MIPMLRQLWPMPRVFCCQFCCQTACCPASPAYKVRGLNLKSGGRYRARTCDLLCVKQTLWPTELIAPEHRARCADSRGAARGCADVAILLDARPDSRCHRVECDGRGRLSRGGGLVAKTADEGAQAIVPEALHLAEAGLRKPAQVLLQRCVLHLVVVVARGA